MSRRRTPVKFVADPNAISGYGGGITNKDAGYELVVEGDDDIILVRGENGAGFRVNRSSLVRVLQELQPHSEELISSLSSNNIDLLHTIVYATRVLYAYPAAYALVTQDIHAAFPPGNGVEAGTVRGFFSGCSAPSASDQVPRGCQLNCTPSMPGIDTDTCNDLVLIYQNGALKSLNDQSTSHAYVYINDTDKLSLGDLTQLQSAGVVTITLITTDKEGNYREYNNWTINALLQKETDNSQETGGEITQTSAGTSWIIFFAIIIVLGALIYIIATNWKRFA